MSNRDSSIDYRPTEFKVVLAIILTILHLVFFFYFIQREFSSLPEYPEENYFSLKYDSCCLNGAVNGSLQCFALNSKEKCNKLNETAEFIKEDIKNRTQRRADSKKLGLIVAFLVSVMNSYFISCLIEYIRNLKKKNADFS